MKMNRRIRFVLVLLVVGFLSYGIGACESHSRGAKLFQENRCKECHTIDGKGGAVGPNLSFVGSRRSRDYIVQQIENPSSHNPNTAMPSFKKQLSKEDIDALADYLSNKK